MPEAVAGPEAGVPQKSRGLQAAAWVSLAGLAIAFAFYLRLFQRVQARDDVFSYFYHVLLPAAAIHTVCFLLLALALRCRARGILLFWAASAAVAAGFGGWSRVAALFLIVLFGVVLVRAGKVIGGRIFPPGALNWGLSLSLAIVSLSAAGAFLASIHLLKWWILASLVLLAILPDLKARLAGFRSDAKSAWEAFLGQWSFALALELQAMFLLSAYAFVSALAPETNSDAVRFYWPYMRLLRHYSGFFDGPLQWCYIIPQAGLVYGSAVLSLLGTYAVRLSMLLTLAALIGIGWRRGGGLSVPMRGALIVVLASTPLVLWVATSLMLDTFVCLTVVALAVLCAEGKEPSSGRFWIAVGILAGVAWAAKFSTLAYTAPLVVYAAIRCFKTSGFARTFRGLALSAVSLLATLSPWLYHSYQQSGNPVFPFLLKWFPSPLWPRGVGFANLDTFRMLPGWRGWLLWPIDLIYHSSKYVEGYDGKLGLIFLLLLILSVVLLRAGASSGRALTVIALLSTSFLWSQTVYMRYWLPSLWLVVIALGYPMKKPVRWPHGPVVMAAAAFLIMMPQILFGMVNYWADSQGWPWQVFMRRMSQQAYLGRQFEALSAAIDGKQALDRGFPKIWFTGYEAVGHLRVQPMEATIWELSLHTLGPREQIRYLITAGCKYWMVNEDDQDAMWFWAEGISHYFWNPSNLVVRSGPLAVYRLPPLEPTLREFDARSAPGTELLLNGGFEAGNGELPKFWLTNGDAPVLVATDQCLEGRQCVQMRLKSGLRQGIALPPGLKNVELLVNARSANSGQPTTFRIQIYSLGFEKDPATVAPENQVQPDRGLTGKELTETVGDEWKQISYAFPIPQFAHFVVVGFDKPEGSGEVLVDSIHLYSRQ